MCKQVSAAGQMHTRMRCRGSRILTVIGGGGRGPYCPRFRQCSPPALASPRCNAAAPSYSLCRAPLVVLASIRRLGYPLEQADRGSRHRAKAPLPVLDPSPPPEYHRPHEIKVSSCHLLGHREPKSDHPCTSSFVVSTYPASSRSPPLSCYPIEPLSC
jgi:hypothetical protein